MITNDFVTTKERINNSHYMPMVLWFTGVPSSGKTTLISNVERKLFERNAMVYHLDGDIVRNGLNNDLKFSDQDRSENIRRASHVAKLFYDAGHIVLCGFVTPKEEMRKIVHDVLCDNNLSIVYVHCTQETAIKRDVKGLYQKAKDGVIDNFTGYNAPYEKPQSFDLFIDTENDTAEQSVNQIIKFINIKNSKLRGNYAI